MKGYGIPLTVVFYKQRVSIYIPFWDNFKKSRF